MSRLWKRYNAWRVRRQQLSVARWAQERKKGRAQFVLREALTYIVLMIAQRDVLNNIFDGSHAFSFQFYIVQHALTGIFVGYGAWASREDKYNLATRYNRIKPH